MTLSRNTTPSDREKPTTTAPVSDNTGNAQTTTGSRLGRMPWASRTQGGDGLDRNSNSDTGSLNKRPRKWTMGMLNDRETDEVPGTSLSGMTFWTRLTDDQARFYFSPKSPTATSRLDYRMRQQGGHPLRSRPHSLSHGPIRDLGPSLYKHLKRRRLKTAGLCLSRNLMSL